MLLDELERSENDCENLQAYVAQFHEADKRAAILQEKLRPETALQILFGVGVGLGGAIIGLAPTLWSPNNMNGEIAFAVGLCLIVGAVIGRMSR